MTKKRPEPNAAKPYDKTSQERTAIDRFLARYAANSAPRLKVTKGKEIAPHHPDALAGQLLLMDALGTGDPEFYNGLIDQLARVGSQGDQTNEQTLNFMLSVVKGVQPKDQLEAMLAAQMAAVHMLSLAFAQRLTEVENLPQQDSATGAFNKLTRTFTSQMEALKTQVADLKSENADLKAELKDARKEIESLKQPPVSGSFVVGRRSRGGNRSIDG